MEYFIHRKKKDCTDKSTLYSSMKKGLLDILLFHCRGHFKVEDVRPFHYWVDLV